jgi:hypothetical protein
MNPARRFQRLRPSASEAERGSSLIIALVFILVFGLSIVASLTYANTSFLQDSAHRQARDAIAGADGAVKTLINAMRSTLTWGRFGQTCDGLTYTLADGRTATVTCTPDSGSGAITGGVAAPTKALVLNAVNPFEAGITLVGAGTMHVGGSVLSSSSIDVQQPTGLLDAGSGDVSANGACDITRITAASVTCNGNFNAALGQILASYTPPLAQAPAVQAVPACPGGAAKYLALSPGTYTDAAALTALTNGGCPGLVLHLLPGTFLFSFTQQGFGAQWRISDPTVDVIGGTPKGWSAGPWGVRPTLPVPGACQTAADPQPTTGVILAFGAESQLYINGAHNVEFCAPPWNGGTRTPAIYGLTAPITGSRAQDKCVALAGGCPFISVVAKTDASAHGVLHIDGTVYAPEGNITVDYTNGTVADFNWGVVARSVKVQGLAGASSTPFSLPNIPTVTADRSVVLTAVIDGITYVRAQVHFVDNSGANAGQSVSIVQWSSAK